MEQLQLNGTILVVVPHSDDEIILFGGLIQRALQEKHDVHVALVTNGDYEATTEEEGITRPLETLAGLKLLGLQEENIHLMGYADIGMPKAESFVWRLWSSQDENRVEPSHVGVHTYGPDNHLDFHSSRHGIPASYTKRAFREDLLELLNVVKPDMVFTTHPLDAHGDHAGLYQFLREMVSGTLYTAFCHSYLGDVAWPLQSNLFTCPPDMEQQWESAVKLELTEAERLYKGNALEVHKAALKPDAVVYLRSFIKSDEIYFPMEENK